MSTTDRTDAARRPLADALDLLDHGLAAGARENAGLAVAQRERDPEAGS